MFRDNVSQDEEGHCMYILMKPIFSALFSEKGNPLLQWDKNLGLHSVLVRQFSFVFGEVPFT